MTKIINDDYANIKSPLGLLKIIASQKGLVAILWENEHDRQMGVTPKLNKKNAFIMETIKQLQEYFLGEREEFELPLDIQGTDFQRKVWQVLRTISYGKTFSYLDVAKKIGKPTAARAVGMAIGNNPLSIIIPCHRVIGTNGKLTGFAGGLQAKAFLLDHEKKK